MKKLLLVMSVLVLVGVVNAATINWEPTVVDPNTGAADWSLTTSWGDGAVPTSEDTILFREYSGVECRVTGDEAAKNVRIGRRGAYPGPLRIMPGASLTCGGANSFVGDDYVGHMVIERGGTFDVSDPGINVGDEANATGSTLTINGGTVTTTGFISLASEGGGGSIDLNGGLIEASSVENDELMWGVDNTIDINFGTIIIHQDITTDIAEEIAAGRLTAFGGAGTIVYGYEGDATTITATGDPLARIPTYDAVIPVGDVDLSWVNLDPNAPGEPVWVDVWFGTDENSLTKVVDANTPGGVNATSVTVSAPVFDEYIWRVDTYSNSHILLDEGMTMYFVASDDAPPSIVINTPPTVTWIGGDPIDLTATVYDDGKTDVTVTWTADDPNAVFDPLTTVIPAQASYEDTGITVTTSVSSAYPTGRFYVTATASDLNPLGETGFGVVEVFYAETPCGAARNQVGLGALYPTDVTGDCMHNLLDFEVIALEWIADGYALTEPQIIP